MSNDEKLHIHIDSSDVHAPEPMDGKCPKCGSSNIEQGFGLAGGGYGAYSYCDDCGTLFDKVEVGE